MAALAHPGQGRLAAELRKRPCLTRYLNDRKTFELKRRLSPATVAACDLRDFDVSLSVWQRLRRQQPRIGSRRSCC